MKVYEALAHAFANEGVSTVFGMMGSATVHWFQAMDKLGIRMMEVRHEGVGVGMADGWARLTRTPGICSATCGPGVAQLATALVTANRASSPLVAFVGECGADDQENAQRFDQERFAAACETAFVRVASPDSAHAAVRKAFYLAKLESRPVLLSAPTDVQQMQWENDEPYEPSATLMPTRIVEPDRGQLGKAADLIAASRRPVILVGRGALWSGAAGAVIKLGKRIGALIVTSLMAKGYLSETEYHVGVSGTYATRTAMQLFQEADCVIGVGASMNRYTLMQGYQYPNARVVQIDLKPHVLIASGRAADCYIQADARAGIAALEKLLAERSVQLEGYRTGDVRDRLARHFEDRTDFEVEPGSLDPRAVCMALDEVIPGDVGLVMGSGTNSGYTTMLCNRPRPWVLGGNYFGCIGQNLPAAMGAAVAAGNKPTLLIDGDASMMMHLADFETAVRYRLPVLAVVLNDQALGSEYHKMRAHEMNTELSIISTPDLGAVAQVFGGKGVLARSIEAVRTAAAEWVRDPGPMIIDARISRNVMTIPYRRVLYGRDE